MNPHDGSYISYSCSMNGCARCVSGPKEVSRLQGEDPPIALECQHVCHQPVAEAEPAATCPQCGAVEGELHDLGQHYYA